MNQSEKLEFIKKKIQTVINDRQIAIHDDECIQDENLCRRHLSILEDITYCVTEDISLDNIREDYKDDPTIYDYKIDNFETFITEIGTEGFTHF